jgi:MFS family permease
MEITVVPLWITEVAPPSIRGVLGNFNGIFVNLGYITASYVGVGIYYANSTGNSIWRGPLAIGCLPCIIGIIWVLFVPESPRYLLLNDQGDKAWNIIRSFHSRDDDPTHLHATAEYYQIRKQLEFERTLNEGYLAMWKRPSYRKRCFMACGLTFFILSSGSIVINSK